MSGHYALRAMLRAFGSRVRSTSDTLIQGLGLFGESLRMRIPYDTQFDPPRTILYTCGALQLVLSLAITLFGATIYRMSATIYRISAKDAGPKPHELLEQQIRTMTIFHGLAETLHSHKFETWVKERWKAIEVDSYKQGYALGIAHSRKFLSRLDLAEDTGESTEDPGESIYTLLTSSTGLELAASNDARRLMRKGQHHDAVSEVRVGDHPCQQERQPAQ